VSYDILIFEPDAVADEDFPQWWDRGSRWEGPHHYDSIERATPAIRAFYRDLLTWLIVGWLGCLGAGCCWDCGGCVGWGAH